MFVRAEEELTSAHARNWSEVVENLSSTARESGGFDHCALGQVRKQSAEVGPVNLARTVVRNHLCPLYLRATASRDHTGGVSGVTEQIVSAIQTLNASLARTAFVAGAAAVYIRLIAVADAIIAVATNTGRAAASR
jgi:hypothetical protein